METIEWLSSKLMNDHTISLYFTLRVDDFHPENIIFLPSKPNRVIDGSFTNMIYSDSMISYHGIYFHVSGENDYSKLYQIEQDIVNCYKSYCNSTKLMTSVFRASPSFPKGYLRNIFMNNFDDETIPSEKLKNSKLENSDTTTLIKISGIWETETSIGITVKYLR